MYAFSLQLWISPKETITWVARCNGTVISPRSMFYLSCLTAWSVPQFARVWNALFSLLLHLLVLLRTSKLYTSVLPFFLHTRNNWFLLWKLKYFSWRFNNAWITTLNHQILAEWFLVVEDLALIIIPFCKLLTVTRFLITGTSNLCVINQFWWLLRYFLWFSLYSVWIKLVTMSEFLISLFSEGITVTHDQLRMMHPNDPSVLFIPYSRF